MDRIGVIPLPAAMHTMFFALEINLKFPSGLEIQMGKSVVF
jgi:hypothetical protein